MLELTPLLRDLKHSSIMTNMKRPFPLTTYVYLWMALLIWCGLPFWVVVYQSLHGDTEISSAYLGAIAFMAIIALLIYASIKCGSDQLSFMKGMLYITCYMQTGWTYMSLVTVMMAIPLALIAVFGIVVRGLISGDDAERYQTMFHNLVGFFYKNRMIQ